MQPFGKYLHYMYGNTPEYKNAFQWDAYSPLVDGIPACTAQGGCVSQHAMGRGVYPSMHWAGACLPRWVSAWGCLPRGWGGVSQHAMG